MRSVGAVLGGLPAALLLVACARKAPGPMECHQVSLRIVGLPAQLSMEAESRLDPRTRQAIQELTVRCLTTPFDREFVACVESGVDSRSCFAGFRERHPERVARSQPRRAP